MLHVSAQTKATTMATQNKLAPSRFATHHNRYLKFIGQQQFACLLQHGHCYVVMLCYVMLCYVMLCYVTLRLHVMRH